MSRDKFCPFRSQFSVCDNQCALYDESTSSCGFLSVAENLSELNHKVRWVEDSIDRVSRAIKDGQE